MSRTAVPVVTLEGSRNQAQPGSRRGPRLNSYLLRRLFHKEKLATILIERLTEPLHLNALAIFVAGLGTYRMKVAFDLIVRQQYAFPIFYAAEAAQRYGYKKVTLVELGVASGAGLLNMCRIAERTRKATGIDFDIVGFDSGEGMPVAVDYRDLPEHFQEGDFPMLNLAELKNALPANARLLIGDVAKTAPQFIRTLTADAPLGFVAVDLDYYSATKAALAILHGSADKYLPLVPIYLDDIGVVGSNPWNGELLAIDEFNAENSLRKIAPFTLLRSRRIFKNAQWIDRMFALHVHDHAYRSPRHRRATQRVLRNEYL